MSSAPMTRPMPSQSMRSLVTTGRWRVMHLATAHLGGDAGPAATVQANVAGRRVGAALGVDGADREGVRADREIGIAVP